MKTQQIKRKDLAKIYSKVCDTWKKKIADLMIDQIDSDNIEVSNDLIKEAYKLADSTQKDLIEKYFDIISAKTIMQRINNLEDIYKELEIDEEDVLVYKNPKTKFEKYINACAIIPRIVEVYNEGEEIDWKNTNQYKYTPYKYFSCGHWLVSSHDWYYYYCCSGGFYYKSKELSDDAVKKFRKIYDDYWMI